MSRRLDEQALPGDPLAFIKEQRQMPRKRDASERRIDFKEIYRPMDETRVRRQARRCLDCGNPYCEWKCPLHNYIPNWLALSQQGQYRQAAELMHETNPFPEICGRVCPQDRLCEGACTLNDEFGAVTIGAIEKQIADLAMQEGWRPTTSSIGRGLKVAIVGAGPAGLGCAEYLARRGVTVTVYDRQPEIGGLLTFGIPGFKLEKSVVLERRSYLEDLGVTFYLNVAVGEAITLPELKANNDAVFVATGTYRAVHGDLPGRELAGVIPALDYLNGITNQAHGFAPSERYPLHNLRDQEVIVLGGGDTAMDCVRSAIRQRANRVTCIYRRSEQEMPGSRREVENAREEGVQFEFMRQPVAIEAAATRLKVIFERRDLPGKQEEHLTDRVILAFGFRPENMTWLDEQGVRCDEQGRIQVQHADQSQRTHGEKIYAGGDIVRGADLVVTAIADGRRAAEDILRDLGRT